MGHVSATWADMDQPCLSYFSFYFAFVHVLRPHYDL